MGNQRIAIGMLFQFIITKSFETAQSKNIVKEIQIVT